MTVYVVGCIVTAAAIVIGMVVAGIYMYFDEVDSEDIFDTLFPATLLGIFGVFGWPLMWLAAIVAAFTWPILKKRKDAQQAAKKMAKS